MSTIKVDAITTRTGSGEISLGTTGSQTINRTGDGDLIAFQKGGADSGSISIESSGTAFDGEASHAGLKMFLGGIGLRQNGSDVDNTIDLGWSGGRVKDIYMGGGIYLGGTGSANHLDDYEEGTWTPVAAGESTAGTYTNSYRVGRYIKVGLQVYVSGVLHGSIASSAGAAQVQGLPFAKDSNDTGLATVQWNNMPFNSLGEEDHQTIGLVESSHIHFRANDRRVNEAHTQLTWSNGNISYLRFSAVYRTT